MDWKYKHFTQAATFAAPTASVLDAARAVVGAALGPTEGAPDGFVARGSSAWHAARATVRITPVTNGSQLTVELLVERAAGRYFLLFDPGNYYNGQIDKWFAAIAERLDSAAGPVLTSKTTAGLAVQRGCLTGCLVYLLLGACLAVAAIPLDRALFPQAAGSFPGPFTGAALGLALLVGIAAFLVVLYPDAPASQAIRARLPGGRHPRLP